MMDNPTLIMTILSISLFINPSHLLQNDPTNAMSNKSPKYQHKSSFSKTCRKGQSYQKNIPGRVLCIPCSVGTYQDKDNHQERSCTPCKKVDSDVHEVERHPCTSESDTVWECREGFFIDHEEQCRVCNDCSHERKNSYLGSNCTRSTDTVCCPNIGMTVVWEKGKSHPVCVAPDLNHPTTALTTTKKLPDIRCEGSVHRSNGCLAGEFLVKECSYDNSWVFCKPCQDNTFISETNHNKSACNPCSPPMNNIKVFFDCNKTHDTVYVFVAISQNNDKFIYFILSPLIVIPITLAVISFIVVQCTKRQRHNPTIINEQDNQTWCFNWRKINFTQIPELQNFWVLIEAVNFTQIPKFQSFMGLTEQ